MTTILNLHGLKVLDNDLVDEDRRMLILVNYGHLTVNAGRYCFVVADNSSGSLSKKADSNQWLDMFDGDMTMELQGTLTEIGKIYNCLNKMLCSGWYFRDGSKG